MDATCAIQASIHVFSLVRKYVSRILGTYHYKKTIQAGYLYSGSSWNRFDGFPIF